jgi:hypothetical protein
MTYPASLPQILETLKRSPLSQLSLCSKELFHSNFLAWLCNNYEEAGRATFGEFVTLNSGDKIRCVDREKKNIDLWLKFSGGQELVIENKVKSIPTATQLEEYSEKEGKIQTSFLLLSLSRPIFLNSSELVYVDTNGHRWHYLSYGTLAERLRGVLQNGNGAPVAGSYHRELIEDYITYIDALDQLHEHFSLDNDPSDCFFGRDIVPKDLEESRFYHGVVKMRHAQLAGMLAENLRGHGFEIVTDPSKFWAGNSGYVLTTSGMTRATGLVDFKFPLFDKDHTAGPLILGVQLQGRHFRLVVECHRKSAREAAKQFKAGTTAQHSWFDFNHLKLPCLDSEYPVGDGFNKYGEVFLYRSKKLGLNISATAIVDAFTKYAILARDNADSLRARVMTFA